MHAEAAGMVPPHCRYAEGKGFATPPAGEVTLLSLTYVACSTASPGTK